MYDERRTRQSELLQLLLLDTLYAQPGSERIIFQGGTALRWIHGGTRFSEDLGFVTPMPPRDINPLIAKLAARMKKTCVAQFGPGMAEVKPKAGRESSFKAFFIYRPRSQRQRIAVKMEFEQLAEGAQPEFQRHILRDLPQIPGLLSSGRLVLPYTSSIVLAETAEEILSDKIRALFERKYIKGRDVYDVWWLFAQMGVRVSWPVVKRKLGLYRTPFRPARELDFFHSDTAAKMLTDAMSMDLPRFIPSALLSVYQENRFVPFIDALHQVMADLIDQGMSLNPVAAP